MDFSTITEIIIPALDPNGNQYNFEAVQLDVDGQTLWTADHEIPWTPLWRGSLSLSFGVSTSTTVLTPNTGSSIPALPIREDKNPKGTFELRVLLDLKTTNKSYLRTSNITGREVLAEFTGGVQYTEVPVVISTNNTSRDVYNTSNINFVGLTATTSQAIPDTGNTTGAVPLVIGSTYYQLSSTSPKFIRLQIKTIRAAASQGSTVGTVTCKVKGIDYRLV